MTNPYYEPSPDYTIAKTPYYQTSIDHANFKSQFTIDNNTGITLAICDYSKRISYIPSLGYSSKENEQTVSLTLSSRNLYQYNPNDHTKNKKDVDIDSVVISKSTLVRRPIFIKELGICIGIENHSEVMKTIIDDVMFVPLKKVITEAVTNLIPLNNPGFFGTLCTPDTSIKNMYGYWQNRTFEIAVVHTPTAKESSFTIERRFTSDRGVLSHAEKIVLEGEPGEKHFRMTFNNAGPASETTEAMWFAETPEKVRDVYHTYRKTHVSEVHELKETVRKTTENLDATKTQLDTTKLQLDDTKKKLASEQNRVKEYQTKSHNIHEEKMQELKMQAAHDQQRIDHEKNEHARIQQETNFRHEQEIQTIKKEKEAISAKSTEIAAASNNMKTMVATIPIAISAGVLVSGAMSGGSKAATGVAACSNPVSLGIVAAATAATIGYNCLPTDMQEKVKDYGKSIYKHGKDVISRIGKCAKKAAKKIKNIFDAVLDFFF